MALDLLMANGHFFRLALDDLMTRQEGANIMGISHRQFDCICISAARTYRRTVNVCRRVRHLPQGLQALNEKEKRPPKVSVIAYKSSPWAWL